VRPLIIASFILAGSLTLGAAFAYGVPLAAAIFLLLGATFVSVLDCLYNVPFMRFVRRRERPQMTTVYSTYSDMADILLSALYGLLLMSFDFRAVFATAGIVALAIGLAAIRLPRGL
jgi:sugar phosphate permease